MGRACFVSSCKISHFGRNPVSGGSPPRESKINGKIALRRGKFDQEVANALIVVELEKFSVVKTAKVIIT